MESLQKSFSSPESGAYAKQIGNLLYGINHRTASNIVNTIVDGNSYVFFTRPAFNMSDGNLRNDRTMTNLITTDPNSVQTYVRQLLDPNLYSRTGVACNRLDNYSCFMAVLTNTLKSVSGWPDRILPTYASKPGSRGEQISFPDGITEINNKVDLTLTFEKMDGKINEKVLEVWMEMMSLQVDGICVPYAAFEVLTERNMDTRIYVLEMDVTNRIVTGIAIANAGFPVNDNIGRRFDFEKTGNNKDNTFSIRFEMNGVSYNDPITILEFNLASALFNKEVYNLVTGGSHNLMKIAPRDLYKYNYRGYPIIDSETMELNWYINAGAYENL